MVSEFLCESMNRVSERPNSNGVLRVLLHLPISATKGCFKYSSSWIIDKKILPTLSRTCKSHYKSQTSPLQGHTNISCIVDRHISDFPLFWAARTSPTAPHWQIRKLLPVLADRGKEIWPISVLFYDRRLFHPCRLKSSLASILIPSRSKPNLPRQAKNFRLVPMIQVGTWNMPVSMLFTSTLWHPGFDISFQCGYFEVACSYRQLMQQNKIKFSFWHFFWLTGDPHGSLWRHIWISL